ncbi:MAG: hypothetical protein ACE5IL_15415 [Myxococcota bacterium]
MQALLCSLNDRFSPENLGALIDRRDIFAPSTGEGASRESWLDRLGSLPDPPPDRAGVGYLRAFPAGLREMLRALIYEDLCREDEALPIIWAWAPAYDWEVQAWECPGREGSLGAFTILLKSRYPGDSLQPGDPPTP